jgi:hypothetical protein
MLGRNNDLYSSGSSAEDNAKINAVRYESTENYEKELYKEAANRVIFNNCMPACDIDPAQLKNFDRTFYYHLDRERHCIQDCYNTRMKLHFGKRAVDENMLLDFDALKREY